jgi:hypothetical protein
MLVGRSENACKNRWNSAARRKANATSRSGVSGGDDLPVTSPAVSPSKRSTPASGMTSDVGTDVGASGASQATAPTSRRKAPKPRPAPKSRVKLAPQFAASIETVESTVPLVAPHAPGTFELPSTVDASDEPDESDGGSSVHDFIDEGEVEIVMQSMRAPLRSPDKRNTPHKPSPLSRQAIRQSRSGGAGDSIRITTSPHRGPPLPIAKMVSERVSSLRQEPQYASPSFPASPVASLLTLAQSSVSLCCCVFCRPSAIACSSACWDLVCALLSA